MGNKSVEEILQEIADDMAADAKAFDGKPFNGRTVAEYLGNQGAAIAALANIIKASVLPLLPVPDDEEPLTRLERTQHALKDVSAAASNLANVAEDESRHDTLAKYVADVRRATERQTP